CHRRDWPRPATVPGTNLLRHRSLAQPAPSVRTRPTLLSWCRAGARRDPDRPRRFARRLSPDRARHARDPLARDRRLPRPEGGAARAPPLSRPRLSADIDVVCALTSSAHHRSKIRPAARPPKGVGPFLTCDWISPTIRGTEGGLGRALTPMEFETGGKLGKILRLAVTLLCITGLAVAPAGAGDGSGSGPIGGAANETATAWFVELSSPPAVKGTSKATLKAERDAFKANAAADGVKLTERYSYDSLWNGVSVSVAPSEVASLRSIPGVKAVYPVETLSLPPSESPGNNNIDLKNAVGLTGADIAQTELGLDGSGVTIAIMDSGLDYTLPEFGGCFGPGCKVRGGFDLVGDAYNATPGPAFHPVPQPDANPLPCDPDFADRAEVLAGVASSRNSGVNGGQLWSAGAPGVGRNVIGVASFDNTKATLPAFEVGTTLYTYNRAAGSLATVPQSGSGELVATGTPTTANDGCVAPLSTGLAGKI